MGTPPVPYWLGDRDYYPRGDARREAHIRHIDLQARIDARIVMGSADGSYFVRIGREDLP